MLPGFHAAQHLLLPILGHAVKVLQALFQLLLPIPRKISELGIVFQVFPLLIRRHFAMLIQPLS